MHRYVIGRTDAEVEAPILWPLDVKSRLIRKDPDAGKDWEQKEEGTTEDEMVGWHHRLNGHEFEQDPGDGEGQESLACCSPWGHKQSDTTEQLKNNNKHWSTARFSSWPQRMCSADRLQLRRTNSLINVLQRCPHADLSNIKGIQFLCKVTNANSFQSYLWEIVRSTLVTKHSQVVLWERESITLQ